MNLCTCRAGSGSNAAVPNWTPLLATPAHPDYPSTHSISTGAAITVLSRWVSTLLHRHDSGLHGVHASLVDVQVNYKDGATPFSGVGKDMSAGASWDQDGLAPVVGDSPASARSPPAVRCIGLSLHRLLSAGRHAGRSALGHPVSADRQQCGVRWPQLAQAAECSLVPSGSWATTSWPHPWWSAQKCCPPCRYGSSPLSATSPSRSL